MQTTEELEVANLTLDDIPETMPDDDDVPADEPPTEATAEESAAVPEESAPSIAHPPELLERATVLQIPADEVVGMTSDELRRVVKHADRVGKMVYDMAQSQPKPEPAAVPEEDLSFMDDPAQFDPQVSKFLKGQAATIAAAKEESRLLRERLEKLEKSQQHQSAAQVHARLKTLAEKVAPEAKKLFDVSTPQGKKQYQALLKSMDTTASAIDGLSEEQLLKRAIRPFIEEEPLKEKKEQWDKAALGGKPGGRRTAESAYDAVGRLLDAYRAKKSNGAR